MNNEMNIINERITALEKTVQEQQKEIDGMKKVINFITDTKSNYCVPEVLELRSSQSFSNTGLKANISDALIT